MRATFVLGLTATPIRQDGRHPIILMQCGSIRRRVDERAESRRRGFEHPRLDTLFLAFPVSWKGIVQQYVGRLHRRHSGKEDVRVYDYADLQVPVLAPSSRRRMKSYKRIGYVVT